MRFLGDGLRQVVVVCTPTVSWLVAEGSGGGWRGTVPSVCASLCVLGVVFVFLVSDLRFVWLFCGISGDVVEA